MGWKDIEIRKSEFVAKTQFLYLTKNNITEMIERIYDSQPPKYIQTMKIRLQEENRRI